MPPAGLTEYIERLFPGARVLAVEPLAPDSGATTDSTSKVEGFGRPMRVRLIDGTVRDLVWRTASANDFGHDRRSDRAQQILLAFDDFPGMPRHVAALDVGAMLADGRLVSLRDAGELFLVTSYAEGRPYAEDLRRIAGAGIVDEPDLARADALASYLARLHAQPIAAGPRYRRAIRDLIGHGEGIFGIIDGYPDEVPAAPPSRLRDIERRCIDWRWRLRGRASRLTRTHGDFHPFNVVFRAGVDFTALDASRGCAGDPADDVTAMAINYVFFALDHARAWPRGLGPLWRRFWRAYRRDRDDPGLAEAAPPYLAWRGLVLANPRFYPALTAHARDALLGLVERVLDAGRLDPDVVEALFP
jgi:aminoglycoside phosphotransferase (APT) family kinase protein